MPSTIKNKKGFTLIELLVVIAIIGLLATIVMVSVNSARAKARDAKRRGDLHQIQLALEMYYDTNGVYPICTNPYILGAGDPEVCATTPYSYDMRSLGIVPVPMRQMPIDPINTDTLYGYYYARGYKATGAFSWADTDSPSDYILATRLEGGTGGPFNGWNNNNLNLLLGN